MNGYSSRGFYGNERVSELNVGLLAISCVEGRMFVVADPQRPNPQSREPDLFPILRSRILNLGSLIWLSRPPEAQPRFGSADLHYPSPGSPVWLSRSPEAQSSIPGVRFGSTIAL